MYARLGSSKERKQEEKILKRKKKKKNKEKDSFLDPYGGLIIRMITYKEKYTYYIQSHSCLSQHN